MRKLFFMFVILTMINLVNAANVCVIVDYGDEIKTNCLDVKGGVEGEKLLDSTIFDISWSAAGIYGKALCKIDDMGDEVLGDGCKWGTKYWGFYILKNGAWSYMPVGFSGSVGCWNGDLTSYDGHYCAIDGDVLGFKYGGYGILPNQSNTMLELNEIAIEVNGKDMNVEEGETIKRVKPESKIKISAELKNIYESRLNVQLEATLEEIQNGEDIKERSKKEEITSGDSQELSLDFKIPSEVKAGKYDLNLLIKGEDKNGASYVRELNYEIEIENNQAKITNLENVSNTTTENSDLVINLELEEVSEETVILDPKNLFFIVLGIGAVVVFGLIIKKQITKL